MANSDSNINKLSMVVRPSTVTMLPRSLESIEGAKSALKSLRIVEQIAENEHCDWTIEDCTQAEEVAALSVLMSAGEVSDRAKGVLMALTGYIYSGLSSGTPNLEVWKPSASYNENEMIDYLASYKEQETI